MNIIDYFATTGDIKKYVRGIDAAQELSSFAPVYRPAAKKLINLVGQETYHVLKEYITTPPQNPIPVLDTAVDYTRAALANLMAISWFKFDAGQRNATDKKLYRYQEDQTIEAYLENAWAELDQLINLMEKDIQKELEDETLTYETPFMEFSDHPTYKLRDKLYITNTSEFHAFYNIDSSSYFYYNSVFIQQEVENENIRPRFKEKPTDNDMLYLVKKAIAFETMSIACQRLDYTELPKGIRNDIVKEVQGNKGDAVSIKQALAVHLHNKAVEYLGKIDIRQKSEASATAPVIPDENVNKESNKFYLST